MSNSTSSSNNKSIVEKNGHRFIVDNDFCDDDIFLYEDYISDNLPNESLKPKSPQIENNIDNFDYDILNELFNEQEIPVPPSNNDSTTINQPHKEIEATVAITTNHETNNEINDDSHQPSKETKETSISCKEPLKKQSQPQQETPISLLDTPTQTKTANNKNKNTPKQKPSKSNDFFIQPIKQQNVVNKKININEYKEKNQEKEQEITKRLYSRYVIITRGNGLKVFKNKFIFSIINLVLWTIAFCSLAIIFGIAIFYDLNKKNSGSNNFNWNDFYFIPNIIGILVTFSFTIYQLVYVIKSKFIRGEAKINLNFEERQYNKLTTIYEQSKKMLGIVLGLLLSWIILYFYENVILYFINNKNLNFIHSDSREITYTFYTSLITFIFIFVVLIIYLISNLTIINLVEKDNNYLKNKNLNHYKEIKKNSYQNCLIIVLSTTIIGIILYGIIRGINKTIKNKKIQRVVLPKN